MTEYTAKRNAKRCPTHPGAVLREDVLPAVKRPKTAWKDSALLKQHRCYGHHFTSTSSRRRSIRSSLESTRSIRLCMPAWPSAIVAIPCCRFAKLSSRDVTRPFRSRTSSLTRSSFSSIRRSNTRVKSSDSAMHQTIWDGSEPAKRFAAKYSLSCSNKPVYRTACGKQVHTTPQACPFRKQGSLNSGSRSGSKVPVLGGATPLR